jgi:hypothetical protein
MSQVFRFGEGLGRRTLLVEKNGSVRQLRKGDLTFSQDAETWDSLSDWAASNVCDFLDTLPSYFSDDAKTLLLLLLRGGYSDTFDFVAYDLRKSRPFGGLDDAPLFLRSDGKLLYKGITGRSFSSLNIDASAIFSTSRNGQIIYLAPKVSNASQYFSSINEVPIVPTMTFETSDSVVPVEYNNLSAYFDNINEFVANSSGFSGPVGFSGRTGPLGPSGVTGATRPIGPSVLSDSSGPTGPSGPAGLIGQTGATGPTGSTGPKGSCSCLKKEDIKKIIYETIGKDEPTFSYITSGSNIYSSDTLNRSSNYWDSPVMVSSLSHYWECPPTTRYPEVTETTLYLPNTPVENIVTTTYSMSSSNIPGYEEPIITSDGILLQKKGESFTVQKVTDKKSSCCTIA